MNCRFGILVLWDFWHSQCRRSINLLKLQTQTNASALIPDSLCLWEINGYSSSSPGKCLPSKSRCFWKVASVLMFTASCLFCHACQSCNTSSSDLDYVLYAGMPMYFFFFFLQLGKVGLSKTFHFILYWWYSAGTMLHHRSVTKCLFTVVTFVPSLHILLTLTIDLIAKVYNYFKKYYRYKNWIHCFCCYIPGKLGCSEQARLVESINIDQNNVSINPKFILFAYYEWHNF